MEFINTISTEDDGATLSRRAHSHAAKAAHARTRRLCMAQYMHQKSTPHMKADDEPQNRTKDSENVVSQAQDECKRIVSGPTSVTTQTLPKSIDGAFEHEPLAGFLRSLSDREHFLFDHCTFRCSYRLSSYFVVLILWQMSKLFFHCSTLVVLL